MPLRLYSCSRLRRPARHGRAVGLDRRFGLDTGLLVDRDDQHVLGRIHVQPADLAHPLLEPLTREVRHDPVVGPVRLDLRTLENHVGLGLRHPDLLAQLPVAPALPPLTRLLRLRTRARFRDQQRPGLRTVRQRPSRPRRVPQPRHPVTHIARTPLLHRPLRAPHRFSDLRGAQPLTRRQHDPRPLDHPHLRTRRAHDPLKLPPVLVADLHPPAHTRDRHHHPPSSPNMTRRSSRTAPTNPYLGANLQEPPLEACRGAIAACSIRWSSARSKPRQWRARSLWMGDLRGELWVELGE